jgi:hypothetical protein
MASQVCNAEKRPASSGQQYSRLQGLLSCNKNLKAVFDELATLAGVMELTTLSLHQRLFEPHRQLPANPKPMELSAHTQVLNTAAPHSQRVPKLNRMKYMCFSMEIFSIDLVSVSMDFGSDFLFIFS